MRVQSLAIAREREMEKLSYETGLYSAPLIIYESRRFVGPTECKKDAV